MTTFWQDVRYAVRMLRKSPTFTFAAVLTLALAIGANAVVFGALNALILRPLNVPRPESLYMLERASDKSGKESYLNYVDLRDRNRTFDGLAACNFDQAGLDTGQNASRVWFCEASGNYFDVLGIRPYLGRVFHASDEHGPNSAPFIVLTHAYWHSHFDDDPAVVGRTVKLNKNRFTIIGVAPPGFNGTFLGFSPAFFVPIVNQEQVDGVSALGERGDRWMDWVVGHLKANVTPAQAVADLNSIGASLKKIYPKDDDQMTFVLARPGLGGDSLAPAAQAFIGGLMLLSALILLAACANLGSLFAARVADLSRELALRLALGSSRARIMRGLFTEAILVSMIGGAVGLWGSVVLLQWLSAWQPFPQYPVNLPLEPDAHVYEMALLLSLVSGFVFGVVPLRHVLRTDPYQVVKAGPLATPGRRIGLRDALLAVQIALCAVLVTSSMVAVRGLSRSLRTNLGFEPRNAVLVETTLSMAGYPSEAEPAMQRRMIDAMKTIPGVESVGLVAQYPPLHLGWNNQHVFSDQASDLIPSNAIAEPLAYSVSPEYFRAARTAVLMGRAFTWRDDNHAPRVAVVNGAFARRVFGSEPEAMGKYFKSAEGAHIQVVGIVETGKYTANLAEDPQPAMFLPILQSPSSETWLVVRSTSNPGQLASAIRSTLRELDSGLPSFIQTWSNEMDGALFAPRLAAASLGVLGAMGMLLSITGIFGLAAYSVSKRLKELGIRMALGAQRKQVLQAALRRPLRLLAFGSVGGIGLGILASRVLALIVYQATPRDPLVLTGAVVTMALLGLMATWIPARRALSLEPLALLRED
jgi:predicted permease